MRRNITDEEKRIYRRPRRQTQRFPDRRFSSGLHAQRALVGMMAKHIVSLYDMCYAKNTSFTKELWDEKITDSLNYLFLLAAIIKEEGTYEQN